MLSWIRENFHPLWRLRRNRGFRWLQNHADIVVTQQVGAIKQHMYLLRDLSMLLPHRMMHEEMGAVFNLVLARLKPELFLDVGANLGGYSWTVYNEVPNCEIWLFEPDRKNAALLTKSVRSSKSSRLRLFDCALSNRCGVAEFIVDDASGSAGSLVDQRDTFYNLQNSYGLKTTAMIETITLDSIFSAGHSRRIFAKIDVEGAETMVLEGAVNMIKQHQPVFVLEAFHEGALRLLHSLEYAIFDFDEDGNYLAVPPEYMGLLTPITATLKRWRESFASA